MASTKFPPFEDQLPFGKITLPLKPHPLYVKIMDSDISGKKQELDAITKVITETVPVESIYLFGSHAYGTAGKDSDLDLYVVFKDDLPIRELDAIFAISAAIGPIQQTPIDIIGSKQNRFLDKAIYATLERKIAREGIKLYG